MTSGAITLFCLLIAPTSFAFVLVDLPESADPAEEKVAEQKPPEHASRTADPSPAKLKAKLESLAQKKEKQKHIDADRAARFNTSVVKIAQDATRQKEVAQKQKDTEAQILKNEEAIKAKLQTLTKMEGKDAERAKLEDKLKEVTDKKEKLKEAVAAREAREKALQAREKELQQLHMGEKERKAANIAMDREIAEVEKQLFLADHTKLKEIDEKIQKETAAARETIESLKKKANPLKSKEVQSSIHSLERLKDKAIESIESLKKGLNTPKKEVQTSKEEALERKRKGEEERKARLAAAMAKRAEGEGKQQMSGSQ